MQEVVHPKLRARFESFELNLRSQELRKNGDRVKLPGQSLHILTMLLERPGEVVMRREIQNRLWPDDTNVEFENSISAAIKRLRAALGDSAEQPKYIETLARRGYRWMAPVEWIDFVSTPAGLASWPRATVALRTASRRRAMAYIFGVVFALGVAAWAYFFTHRAPKLTSRDPIIIAEFANSTGDPVFDGTLRQGLVAQVEQSPYLNILSDEQIAETLRLMSQPAGARLTHELARAVCKRTGATVTLDGSIAQIGSEYQLILSAFDCSTGALIGSVQSVASDKNHVLDALGSAASALRAKLGESLATIRKFNTPLEEVTTPSLDALQAYTLGWQAELNGDESAATGSFERAISLDPNFAMAYATLGRSYGGLGESSLAAASTQKAYALRDRVSEREKLYITSHFEMNVTGDLEKANDVFKLWTQIYPWDEVPVGEIGWDFANLGKYEESLEAGRRALKLAPNREMPYELLAYSYLELDRFDEAAAIIQKGQVHGIDSAPLHELAYFIAWLKGDDAVTTREVAWGAGKPEIEDQLAAFQSDAAANAGQLARASDLTARAVASARRTGAKERAAIYLAAAALHEALVDQADEARIDAASALLASSDRETQFAAALALALAHNTGKAQPLAENLSNRYPQDTIVQFNYLPTIRAAIALEQKSPMKALAYLEAAAPYELGTPYFSFGPVYMRGQAYLAAHQGSAAAAEFQKILNHRGIALNAPGPLSALAQLGLARAYALQGDAVTARAAYKYFFTLWKDADHGISILIAAKAEYAKLQ